MGQASVAGEYFNSNLFSNYYLDERVYDLDAWDCDEAAREALESLQALYDREGDLLSDRKADALIDELVYGLYGLTDEEIDIVEAAVGE